MPRKEKPRTAPSFYIDDATELASQLEQYTSGHDYDDWQPDLAVYNGEVRLIIKALRAYGAGKVGQI